MADDITLTVRVRDLTRGELNQLRNRLRGMDGDMRRLSQSSGLASDRARRLSQDIRGASGRLAELQRTGRMAGHEMDFMRRSMGLMSRDLRNAARSGELTADEFRDLQRELEGTRLDFDRLDNQMRRHSAVAQRAHREELARQRAAAAAARQAEAERRRAAADEERRLRRTQREAERAARERARAAIAAARLQAREEAAAMRDAERVRMAAMQRRRQQEAAARREMARMHTAALREEAQRVQRAEAERRRAASAAAADLRRRTGALAGLGGGDQDLTMRFRAMGEGDLRRMSRGFTNLQGSIAGVTGSTARARRSIQALGGDLSTMSQVLRGASDAGSITRREFNALSNGLRLTVRDARQLVRSGDMTRASFRDTQREVAYLRAQLRLLGGEGNRLARLSDGMLLLQRRMRDTSSGAGFLRRSLSRMGEGAVGGMRPLVQVLSHVQSGFGRLRKMVSGASRGMRIFLLVLALLGPLAPAVGALLTTVLGGAFVALGAFALRGEKDVKNAFTHMKGTIGVAVRAAAQPLKGALVVAMHEVAEATQEMGNALSEAFQASGPLVSDLAGAFTDLASGALPGVVESLREMGPVMEGFRSAMGTIGEGFGQMFAAMTSGGGAEGLGDTWRILGDGIKSVLVNVGEFINAMSQSETATTILSTAFGVLSSILIVIEGIFAAIDAVLGPLLKKMNELGLTTGLIGLVAKGFEALGVSAVDVDSSTSSMVDGLKGTSAAQQDAAVKTLSHAEALRQLNEQIKEHNNQNLSRFDAEAALNQAFQDAKKKTEDLGNSVKINNGIFDTTHENTRKVYQDFSKLAENTQLAVDASIKAKQPLEEQNRLWKLGETNIRALGKAYGIPKAELDAFIALVLKTPESAKTELEVEAEEAIAKATDLTKKVKNVDGFKAKIAAGLEAAAAVREAGRLTALLNGLNGRTTRSRHIHTRILTEVMTRVDERASPRFEATGGMIRRATGGRVLGFPGGGPVSGPGTSMSDSIPAQLSDGEFVIRARAVQRYGTPLLDAINQGRMNPLRMASGGHVARFAKGGVSKSEREARKDAAGELTISAAGRLAGRKNTELANALGDPASLNDLIGAINKWRGIIKKATHGGVENALLKSLSKAGKSLINYQKQHDKIAKTLEKAKAVRESVRTGVLSATNITQGNSGDTALTMGKLMTRMRQGRDKSTAFASAIRDLRKKGVSKDIIKQIADAGIEGGGLETAGALLRASTSEIASMNQMQSQINASAKKAGDATADAMFGAGAKAAEGLIAGLEKKQKAIEKAMMKIAKSMEKALKKALGIKSPSKVMEQVGDFTAEGFAVGVKKNSAKDAAWSSMLSPSPTGTASSGSYGGRSGGPSVINVYIGEKKIDEIILDSNRRSVRTRGGNVQATFGRKNG